MRDEMDGRIWVASHQQFASDIDILLGRLRSAFTRVPAWDGTTGQLLALVAAFLITALTFNTTGA
ncbi:MAG TPA: hypothetical protein VFO69_08835 [Allosphingosinicella sp.]|nr:hypothetical protein [Allosphingosinicella sp.]